MPQRLGGAPAASLRFDPGNTNAGEEGLMLELHDIVALTLVELARLEERWRVELRVEVPRRRCGGTAKTRTTARNGWFSSFTELVWSLRSSCIGWRWCGGWYSAVEQQWRRWRLRGGSSGALGGRRAEQRSRGWRRGVWDLTGARNRGLVSCASRIAPDNGSSPCPPRAAGRVVALVGRQGRRRQEGEDACAMQRVSERHGNGTVPSVVDAVRRR